MSAERDRDVPRTRRAGSSPTGLHDAGSRPYVGLVMRLGAGEIILILAIVLLLFGPSKLPKLGEGLGSAISGFKKAMRGDGA
jgi:sec-independent protein translocase protein TatA